MASPVSIITVDEAINRIKMGAFQRQVLFATGTCFMADSMMVMLLSFLTRRLQRDWEFDDNVSSTITSSLFGGAMIGTLILGPAGDRVGRKPILILSAIIISTFGIATSLCNDYLSLIAIEFLVGFGIGGLTVPFDILAEFLPTETRGEYLLLIKYFWTVGSCIIPLFAYLSLEIADSWRLFAVLCALPSLFSSVVSIAFVPESPRWLVSMGQKDKALQILRDAGARNGVDIAKAFPDGIALADEEVESSNFGELLSPRWRKLTLTLWAVWAGFAFCYFSIIMTITRIFDEEDDNDAGMDFDYVAIFISSFSEFIGTALAIQLVDRIGRIKALVGSFLIAGASMFVVCVFNVSLDRVAIVSFAFISRASEMAAACITWITTAELLSTNMRSTGHAAANSVARCGAFFSPFLVNDGDLGTIGIALIIASVAAALFASRLPETSGVELGKAIILEEEEEIRRIESGSPASGGFW
eukprot:CAMPEP_0203697658 /NCGR_PEP_ID=MMETSP0091-20130426/11769_1 /ASSEMBLY_ACC=CAM_ASM_001089 /TAXON_ID=426623 /ORGANISM="Chaetoceros affinis, Strain CCMP159" /LENGTH=471 /DNA_ID=CAMNT_0050569717 /DNA_START=28 /DNA_END=1440 /DNA_ORIENTATION=-